MPATGGFALGGWTWGADGGTVAVGVSTVTCHGVGGITFSKAALDGKQLSLGELQERLAGRRMVQFFTEGRGAGNTCRCGGSTTS